MAYLNGKEIPFIYGATNVTITGAEYATGTFTAAGTETGYNVSSLNFKPDVVIVYLTDATAEPDVDNVSYAIRDAVNGISIYFNDEMTTALGTPTRPIRIQTNGFVLYPSIASGHTFPAGNGYTWFAVKYTE